MNFEVKVLADSPGNDLYKKARELTDLFASGGIKAGYWNTAFSSEHNVVVRLSQALPREVISEINELLRIVFKNTLYFELLKPGGEDSDGNINIFFLGTPSFDNEGCVFYDSPMF